MQMQRLILFSYSKTVSELSIQLVESVVCEVGVFYYLIMSGIPLDTEVQSVNESLFNQMNSRT